jgi:hypothetical protein
MILGAVCYAAAACLLAVTVWMLRLGVAEWRRDRGPDALEAQLEEIRGLPEYDGR